MIRTLLSGLCLLAAPALSQLDTVGVQIPGEEEGLTYELVNDLLRYGEQVPRPRTPGAVRLATYNVENLFDDIDDPELTGRGDDADMLKPMSHRHAAARAIRAIDADVLTLQEIESESVLRWFRDEFLADMGYEHIASIDAGDGRGIEQAVLSRYPITQTQNWPGKPLGGVHPEKYGNNDNWHAGEPLEFRRSPLLVEVEVPADAREQEAEAGSDSESYRVSLLIVHHKSGRHAGYWREAEAKGLLAITQELMAEQPGRNLAILGDFNARPNEDSVRTYTDNGFIDVFGSPSPRNRKVATHVSGRRIDLILVNEALRDEIVPESAWVMATVADELNARRGDPPPPGWASDHYPVVVDLVPREGAGAAGNESGGAGDSLTEP